MEQLKADDQYPLLSVPELKVCSMMKAGLTTKEIATLLHRSERSIESHRLSVRRKLGLSRDQNLAAVLAAI